MSATVFILALAVGALAQSLPAAGQDGLLVFIRRSGDFDWRHC